MTGTRDVEKFTTAESFRLFMEGLRSLQLHEDEANKRPDVPSRDVLEQTLSESKSLLARCVAIYPDDLLPRYYHGLVLSTLAQTKQAAQLRSDLKPAAPPPDDVPNGSAPEPARRPLGVSAEVEDLYRTSSAEFGKTAAGASGDVYVYAQYNRAQALGKAAQALALRPNRNLDEIRKLSDEALAILRDLSPLSDRLRRRLSFEHRSRLDRLVGSVNPRSWFSRTKWIQTIKRDAVQYQVAMLIEFTSHFQDAVEGKLRLHHFPEDGRSPTVSEGDRRFELRLGGDDPSQAREDTTVDYWNKWAHVARMAAQVGNDESERAQLLTRAHGYYERLKALDRGGWAPALLNEAFVWALQEETTEANKALAQILGKEPDSPAPGPPVPARSDVEAIKDYILAMPLGTPAATVAHLVNTAFGLLDAQALQALVRALDHARLKMEYIEEIVGALEIASPVEDKAASSPPESSQDSH